MSAVPTEGAARYTERVVCPEPGFKMRAIRVYVDTSVIGGIEDDEFAEPTRHFFEDVRRGEYVVLVSVEVLANWRARREPFKTSCTIFRPIISRKFLSPRRSSNWRERTWKPAWWAVRASRMLGMSPPRSPAKPR